MMVITTPLAHLLLIVIIGIAAGFGLNRFGSGWLARNFGSSTRSNTTASLVGIAGAFMGFQLGAVLQLLPSPLMLYVMAGIGAIATLWLWRGR